MPCLAWPESQLAKPCLASPCGAYPSNAGQQHHRSSGQWPAEKPPLIGIARRSTAAGSRGAEPPPPCRRCRRGGHAGRRVPRHRCVRPPQSAQRLRQHPTGWGGGGTAGGHSILKLPGVVTMDATSSMALQGPTLHMTHKTWATQNALRPAAPNPNPQPGPMAHRYTRGKRVRAGQVHATAGGGGRGGGSKFLDPPGRPPLKLLASRLLVPKEGSGRQSGLESAACRCSPCAVCANFPQPTGTPR